MNKLWSGMKTVKHQSILIVEPRRGTRPFTQFLRYFYTTFMTCLAPFVILSSINAGDTWLSGRISLADRS